MLHIKLSHFIVDSNGIPFCNNIEHKKNTKFTHNNLAVNPASCNLRAETTHIGTTVPIQNTNNNMKTITDSPTNPTDLKPNGNANKTHKVQAQNNIAHQYSARVATPLNCAYFLKKFATARPNGTILSLDTSGLRRTVDFLTDFFTGIIFSFLQRNHTIFTNIKQALCIPTQSC